MNDSFFNDFPTDITKKILELTPSIISQARGITGNIIQHREHDRMVLIDKGLIKQEGYLEPFIGYGYAVDGSCILNKKSFGDLVFTAAIKAPFGNVKIGDNDIENLKENMVSVNIVPRNRSNESLMKSLMALMELNIAHSLNADFVMLDGSFFSYIMSTTNGRKDVLQINDNNNALVGDFNKLTIGFEDKIVGILENPQYIGFPKYSLSNDLSYLNNKFNLSLKCSLETDTKSNLSYLLEEGEYLIPIRNHSSSEFYSNKLDGLSVNKIRSKYIMDMISDIHSIYYKPWPWIPAIRIDTVGFPNMDRLKSILSCVKDSTKYHGIFEPYPLFLTDRWAKGISSGASAVIDSSAISCIDDVNLKMLFAMSYRT